MTTIIKTDNYKHVPFELYSDGYEGPHEIFNRKMLKEHAETLRKSITADEIDSFSARYQKVLELEELCRKIPDFDKFVQDHNKNFAVHQVLIDDQPYVPKTTEWNIHYGESKTAMSKYETFLKYSWGAAFFLYALYLIDFLKKSDFEGIAGIFIFLWVVTSALKYFKLNRLETKARKSMYR